MPSADFGGESLGFGVLPESPEQLQSNNAYRTRIIALFMATFPDMRVVIDIPFITEIGAPESFQIPLAVREIRHATGTSVNLRVSVLCRGIRSRYPLRKRQLPGPGILPVFHPV